MLAIIVREILLTLINVYIFILLGRIIMSFVRLGMGHNRNETVDNIHRFLHFMTEPILRPIRELIPAMRMGGGGIDFSPIIVLLLLRLLQSIIINWVNF